MAASPTPGRWIAILAATAVAVTAAFVVRRHLADDDPLSSHAAPAVRPSPPAAPLPPAAPSPPAVHVDPGDEIFAVDPASVVEVDFDKAGRGVVIHRKEGPHGGFTIANKTDGTAGVPSCLGSAALDDLLMRLTSIKVVRVISTDEASSLKQRLGAAAATLRIRDDTVLDPKEYRVLFPDEPPPRALLLDGPALYETSIPRELFDRLAAGCKVLGRR